MTPRERWLAVLNKEQPDRVPTDYWGTSEITSRLLKDLNCANREELYRKLNIDAQRSFDPPYKKALLPDSNEWGIKFAMVDYGTGAYREAVGHPLAQMQTVAEIDAYAWPKVEDFDYEEMRRQIEADDGYRARSAGIYEPFLLYCYMRGLEQSMEDLLVNQEIAEAILQHIYDYHYERNRRIFEAGQGRIDLTYVAEDLAGQTSPLFSLEVYHKFLRSRQKSMADLARSYGIHVFYHTDGAARVFIPDLVNVVGIEMLNPLQWRCPGMELRGLVKDFGHRVGFHGGIDNQQTLPFGTVEDVVKEVEEVATIMKDARWICAPCHNIQAVTPTANVVAMYETIRKAGKKR